MFSCFWSSVLKIAFGSKLCPIPHTFNLESTSENYMGHKNTSTALYPNLSFHRGKQKTQPDGQGRFDYVLHAMLFVRRIFYFVAGWETDCVVSFDQIGQQSCGRLLADPYINSIQILHEFPQLAANSKTISGSVVWKSYSCCGDRNFQRQPSCLWSGLQNENLV